MDDLLDPVATAAENVEKTPSRWHARSGLQQAGTIVSLVVGLVAFAAFTVDVVVREEMATFGWLRFGLVVIPLIGACASLAQSSGARRRLRPVFVCTGVFLIAIAVAFLRDFGASNLTITAVAVVLAIGGTGNLAHLGQPASHEREAQVIVTLIAGWVVFAGCLVLFVFGQQRALLPLAVATVVVILGHAVNEDPTALRGRFSRARPARTD